MSDSAIKLDWPLRSRRLLYRPLEREDFQAFVDFYTLSREHLRAWTPRVPEASELRRFFDEQIERVHRTMQDGTACRLTAFEPGSPVIVGMFNLNNIVRQVFQNADAGWQVSAAYTGQGLASEGVGMLLDLAFAPAPAGLGLHRVQANVIPSNTASLRVCAKNGFRVEGHARRMLHINGHWQDHVMHAKLAEEHTVENLRPATGRTSAESV